mmetsp:Transcript_7158/g.15302  ORF Transcript_7158/g.15302 Transcript_7158/m.15302 type:complete len:95 (-) Transcript_7158:164-448(-)
MSRKGSRSSLPTLAKESSGATEGGSSKVKSMLCQPHLHILLIVMMLAFSSIVAENVVMASEAAAVDAVRRSLPHLVVSIVSSVGHIFGSVPVHA